MKKNNRLSSCLLAAGALLFAVGSSLYLAGSSSAWYTNSGINRQEMGIMMSSSFEGATLATAGTAPGAHSVHKG